MKRDLQVGIAQWLAAPGEPKRNLQVALDMIDLAAARGRRAPGPARALALRLRPGHPGR